MGNGVTPDIESLQGPKPSPNMLHSKGLSLSPLTKCLTPLKGPATPLTRDRHSLHSANGPRCKLEMICAFFSWKPGKCSPKSWTRYLQGLLRTGSSQPEELQSHVASLIAPARPTAPRCPKLNHVQPVTFWHEAIKSHSVREMPLGKAPASTNDDRPWILHLV